MYYYLLKVLRCDFPVALTECNASYLITVMMLVCVQVESAIMRHIALLRPIYSLYSSLGHENSPDNTFLLNYLQFCRFLKDSSVHQHGLTLAQLDHIFNSKYIFGLV